MAGATSTTGSTLLLLAMLSCCWLATAAKRSGLLERGNHMQHTLLRQTVATGRAIPISHYGWLNREIPSSWRTVESGSQRSLLVADYSPDVQAAHKYIKLVGEQMMALTGGKKCWLTGEPCPHRQPGAQEAALAAGNPCKLKILGGDSVWGKHAMCEREYQQPCYFYSFGTHMDYSYDTQLAEATGCKGLAMDPTVVHPARLHPKVNFMMVAARMLDDRANQEWDYTTSPAGLKKWLGHRNVSVLKMDCEGCEYSIARDIEREDPTFFDSVDQFALEVHISMHWAKGPVYVAALGHLYQKVLEAGFKLRHVALMGCNPNDERAGCPPRFAELGYPCAEGIMCQDLFFAK